MRESRPVAVRARLRVERRPRTRARAIGELGNAASGALARYAILLFVVAISLAPIGWVVVSSFKTNREILDSALSLPANLSLEGYFRALTRTQFGLFFLNSAVVSVSATALALGLFGMAAYVLARYSFPGRLVIYTLLIASMLISLIPMMQPITVVIRSLGLYDTHAALVLVFAAKGLPIAVFVLHSYFKSLPREIEEAAAIDGAGLLQTYLWIALPLARPAIASAGVLIFLNSWNDFLFPLLLTQSEETRVLSYALRFFISTFAYDYPTLFAAIVLTLAPSVVVYVLLQEQIQRSLIGGSLKG